MKGEELRTGGRHTASFLGQVVRMDAGIRRLLLQQGIQKWSPQHMTSIFSVKRYTVHLVNMVLKAGIVAGR